MDVSSLRKEISDIQDQIRPHLGVQEDHHEKLFDVFRQIDAAIAECSSGDAADDSRAANLIEAQSVVIRTAAALPARCMRDLLYKLAIWRWDAPEIEQPVKEMGRSDAIAYSAFLDLSKMLGERDVLKDFDKTN
ncbi:hypothetical protein [Hyphococcus sp.]|uniref:hypothetical protein n=1 Tax=Hyphococcus sp. TaxID=2038636 RepID=UPI00208B026A|nr:MAG: hypothetical protein DHS20C04_25510 [Marinicaulis sp.]